MSSRGERVTEPTTARLSLACDAISTHKYSMLRFPRWLRFAVVALCPLTGFGHSPAEISQEITEAADTWLHSLDASQRAQAVFSLADTERENWNFVPLKRKGLPLKAMTPAQRTLARQLIATILSHEGDLKAEAIIALENVLHAMEGAPRRDPELYYISVFGEPSATDSWSWRVEGHHLSLNFTLVPGKGISVTPLFFGSNPAEVRIEHEQKGRRVLRQEEDLGRALMHSLNSEQRRIALIADKSPNEIITGNDRQIQLAEPTGLAYAAMTTDQRNQLHALIELYANRLRSDLADVEMKKITDRGWEAIHFAWAGGLEKGEAHYYRIQGPAFIIEYDNTQNNANHIHTSWRNTEGDFGRDLLREHYELSHQSMKSPPANPTPAK